MDGGREELITSTDRLTHCLIGFCPGLALQIQCYQCEEMTRNECSTPEFVVNCTVNVQDMCQKEVLVMEDGESA